MGLKSAIFQKESLPYYHLERERAISCKKKKINKNKRHTYT